MIQLLFIVILLEITIIMVILSIKNPLALMEMVIKVLQVFMKTFARTVLFLLLLFIFLLKLMPQFYIRNIDHNVLDATLKGAIIFLAFTINRLHRYAVELCIRKKDLILAHQRIKKLESERREVNDAEANTIAQSEKLLYENKALKFQLGVLQSRLDSELASKERETKALCKRIEQQESELGKKMKEMNALSRNIKHVEAQLASKTTTLETTQTKMKQLESELKTKVEEASVLGTTLEQLELERVRKAKEKKIASVVRLEELELKDFKAKKDNHVDQKNQLEESRVHEYNTLLDGNEFLKNQLRSLPRRLSHSV